MTTDIFKKGSFLEIYNFSHYVSIARIQIEISEMSQRTIPTTCIFPFFLYNLFHIVIYLYHTYQNVMLGKNQC